MVRKIEDFLNSWKYETEATAKLFSMIDEHRFHEQIHPKVRSCARMAFHITQTIGEMMSHTGIHVEGYHEETDLYWSKQELIETYTRFAQSCAEQINKNWKDDDLESTDNLYGEEWKKGTTLDVLIRHQSHHRGELLVVMRLLEMPVFGIYGPANEEWSQMGMTPQE